MLDEPVDADGSDFPRRLERVEPAVHHPSSRGVFQVAQPRLAHQHLDFDPGFAIRARTRGALPAADDHHAPAMNRARSRLLRSLVCDTSSRAGRKNAGRAVRKDAIPAAMTTLWAVRLSPSSRVSRNPRQALEAGDVARVEVGQRPR